MVRTRLTRVSCVSVRTLTVRDRLLVCVLASATHAIGSVRKNSAVLAKVPDSVRENNDQKRKEKLKQKFAQLKRNASNMNSETLFTELNKIVEETDEGNDTATQQTN